MPGMMGPLENSESWPNHFDLVRIVGWHYVQTCANRKTNSPASQFPTQTRPSGLLLQTSGPAHVTRSTLFLPLLSGQSLSEGSEDSVDGGRRSGCGCFAVVEPDGQYSIFLRQRLESSAIEELFSTSSSTKVSAEQWTSRDFSESCVIETSFAVSSEIDWTSTSSLLEIGLARTIPISITQYHNIIVTKVENIKINTR